MFIAEVKLYAGVKCPMGFLFCDGSYVEIDEYADLYAAIGEAFGAVVGTTFKLPDMRSRLPVGTGTGGSYTTLAVGETVGSEEVTLQAENLPIHSHEMKVSLTASNQISPENNMIGDGYHFIPTTNPGTTFRPMTELTVGNAGGGAGHDNIMPFIAMNYIIRCRGVYPT